MKKSCVLGVCCIFSFMIVGCNQSTTTSIEKNTHSGMVDKTDSGKPAETVDDVTVQLLEGTTPSSDSIPENQDKKDSDEKLKAKHDAFMAVVYSQSKEDAVQTLYKVRGLIDEMSVKEPMDICNNIKLLIEVEGRLGKTDNLETHLKWATDSLASIPAKQLDAERIVGIMFGLEKTLDWVQLLKDGPGYATPLLSQVKELIEESDEIKNENPLLLNSQLAIEWVIAWNAILCHNNDLAIRTVDFAKVIFDKMTGGFDDSNSASMESDFDLESIEKMEQELEEQKEMLSEEDYNQLKTMLDEIKSMKTDNAMPTKQSDSISDSLFSAQFGMLSGLALYFSGKEDEGIALLQKGIKNDMLYANNLCNKNLYGQLELLECRGFDISGLTPIREELEIKLKEIFEQGIKITQVVENSQCSTLDIKSGDTLLKYNGRYVYDWEGFAHTRWSDGAEKRDGDATIEIVSEGEHKTFNVKSGLLGLLLSSP